MLGYFEDQSKSNVNTHPNDEEAIKIYKECYKASSPNLKEETLNKFELCLRETLEARAAKYNNNNSQRIIFGSASCNSANEFLYPAPSL